MSKARRKVNRGAPPRKKACQQCTEAKARCGLEKPDCFRCKSRGFICVYSSPSTNVSGTVLTRNAGHQDGNDEHFDLSFSQPANGVVTTTPSSASSLLQTSASFEHTSTEPQKDKSSGSEYELSVDDKLDFTVPDLRATTDSLQIRNRWMESFLPSSSQRPKILPEYTVQYLSCVLRTYPKCMLRPSGLPPIIHPLQFAGQVMPLPLANCFSLVRLWYGRANGSESIVTTTVKQEMERLLQEYQSYDQMELLAAFQAYLIYALMAYFSPAQGYSLVDHTTLVSLQDLACRISLTGLVCTAELSHSRPKWESWIVASAKRRTLYAMYLFHNVFNSVSQLPNYVADELHDLPVPATKALWEARTRKDWEREYDCHLSTWQGDELCISELWHSPDTGSSERQHRIDQWVQGVDEFGMALFAVCAHIHGC
ncbi:hypothetical protein V1517DRAFT_185555 [Lipomyces orientalis]|uniref:Uncharacterized protein n=1 Tax=Lipomyces orientalis TaxID=1233043 RepID=A0ACC3TIP3_9ASCO